MKNDGDDSGDIGCSDDQFTCDNGECIPASYYNKGALGCLHQRGLLVDQTDQINLVYGKI